MISSREPVPLDLSRALGLAVQAAIPSDAILRPHRPAGRIPRGSPDGSPDAETVIFGIAWNVTSRPPAAASWGVDATAPASSGCDTEWRRATVVAAMPPHSVDEPSGYPPTGGDVTR
jgi:hypothetical protein